MRAKGFTVKAISQVAIIILISSLAGCGGGGGGGAAVPTGVPTGGGGTTTTAAPSITSFTAASSTIPAGGATTLTAVFADGTGIVNNGVGTVTSGVAVSVNPAVTTTYTLTVTNSVGATATASNMVTVLAAPTPILLTFGTASLPYAGTVASRTNGYYRITGLTPGNRYALNVTTTNYPQITYYSDAYMTQIKCDPNVSSTLCILEPQGTDIYIRIWNSSFNTSTVGIDVTHVSAPTQFEGTWTMPTVLDITVPGMMPHVGKTDTYNSYYTIKGLTVGQKYTFWLQSMTADAWLSTLDPVAHTRVGGLCAPDKTWITGFQFPESCTWVATNTQITFAVANTSGTAGAAYILRVDAAVASEGSKATPVTLAYAGGKVTAAGRVAAAGTSYYHVTGLTAGTNYLVSMAGIARSIQSTTYDPPTIQPYSVDLTYTTTSACAASVEVLGTFQCEVAATGTDLYFTVTGPAQYSGMTYNLTVSPVPVAEGNPTAVALTTAQLPYNGQVNQTTSGLLNYLYSNYIVSGLAANTNYQVSLKSMTGTASLSAWATSSGVIDCMTTSDTTTSCSVSSGTGGAINIRVGASSNIYGQYAGALYSLDVKPAFQLSAGATYTDTSGTTTFAGTAIPDPGPTNLAVSPLLIPITVGGSAVTSISDVTVEYFITHGYAPHLTINLIAPDGTVVPLVARNTLIATMGGSGFLGTQLNDYAPVRLDRADGGSPFATEPYNGVFRPRLPLHMLRGKNANGTWTLSILDDQYTNISGQTGAYRAWGISFR